MRYPAAETAQRHDRILEEAARLFRERGLGVPVAEVMAAAGLTHGGFYAHFRSKDDLAAAALRRAFEGPAAPAAASRGAADPVAAFVGAYLTRAHRDHPGLGCAAAALGSDAARGTQGVRAAFADGVRHRLAEVGGPRAEAIRALALTVGALTVARAVGDAELSEEVLAAAREGFGLAPEGDPDASR